MVLCCHHIRRFLKETRERRKRLGMIPEKPKPVIPPPPPPPPPQLQQEKIVALPKPDWRKIPIKFDDDRITYKLVAFSDGRLISSMDIIFRFVAQYYRIQFSDIMSIRREPNIVRARQVATYLAKIFTKQSFPQIGRYIKRDHTSILHAVRKIERLIASGDEELIRDVKTIKKELGAG